MKFPKEIQKIIDNQGKTEEEMRKLIVELGDIFDKHFKETEELLRGLRP